MLRAASAHAHRLKPDQARSAARHANLAARPLRLGGGTLSPLRRARPASQPYFQDSSRLNNMGCVRTLWLADLRQGPIPLRCVRTRPRGDAYTVPVPLRGAYGLRRHKTQYAEALGLRRFHASAKAEGLPLPFYLLAGLLKKSTALEMARIAGRIALTFVPLILFQNMKARRFLKHIIPLKPEWEARRPQILKGIQTRIKVMHLLLFTPLALVALTVLASLERTPLTGRFRLILLSPEEEDGIASELAGSGWYQAVGQILTEDEGATPRLVPSSDWRYTWVQDTLRRLESVIPILQAESELQPHWTETGEDEMPLPPPAKYPLRPRPRYMEMLSRMCYCQESSAPHGVPGPPYSLLVVDKPLSSNAFSYGFGPDGGGGIVVYSGFLDDVLSHVRNVPNPQQSQPQQPVPIVPSMSEDQSWWSYLFGGVFGGANTPHASRRAAPTQEQTSELAILLAHELSHLILAHHLETLSSATVFVPGALSILSDFVRTMLFPVTMFFGPFVNDAVASLGNVGSGELSKLGQNCTSMEQEIEADIVSARLLAHAGFDARDAVKFWETRAERARSSGDPNSPSCNERPANSSTLAMRIVGGQHPVDEVRVDRLKQELERWEKEKVAAKNASHRHPPPT